MFQLEIMLIHLLGEAQTKELIDCQRLIFNGSFSPSKKMGGEKVEHGYKGKGSLFHLMTDSDGKPLYATLTAANGNGRAELPKLLDKVRIVG
ncbi:MAG: hypothetical protein P0S93_00430 [Candidatus Neptunochlamydia sp.]|nr:hypothetical protein [Candidatus Neptunochlamydia sp.]